LLLTMTDSTTLPTIVGKSTKEIKILLVNPNGTQFMTENCLKSLEDTLPVHVSVTGFTSPYPAPSAIEGYLDASISTDAATRVISPIAHQYDAFLVACFSAHPLIEALREEVDGPVIGIMEASLYSARMLGGRFGVVANNVKSRRMQENAVRSYGLDFFSVGSQPVGLSVLELESRPQSEVLQSMGQAAGKLKENGADCVLLGCAGMTEMKAACEAEVGSSVTVIDGVTIGVHLLVALVREGLKTPRAGLYMGSKEARAARGQKWL
jgi:Asp/Glu/hydantoin racemase